MKDKDIELCQLVLRATSDFMEPYPGVKQLLNHEAIRSRNTSSKDLYKAIDLLTEHGLFEIASCKDNRHPNTVKVTPTGYEVRSSENGIAEFVKKVKDQNDRSRKIEDTRYKKDKSDILRNRVWFFIAIPGALYTLGDILGRIVSPGFDILDFIRNIFQ
jgi:hypothetical protein